MEESNNKSYYAIIPANVRYDKDLPSTAKLLYGEITALCNDKGYCWASNNYFATLYSASKKSVSRWVSALEKRGYVTIELMRKEGSKEIIKRLIRINGGIDKNVPYGQKCLGGIDKNVHTPIDKNVQENTTSINNTNKDITKSSFSPFWDAYPIAGRKMMEQTQKNFLKLVKTVNADDVVQAAKNYAASKNGETEFVYASYNFVGQKSYYKDYLPGVYKGKQPSEKKTGGPATSEQWELFLEHGENWREYDAS